MESETDSQSPISIATSFDASITGDELDSAVYYTASELQMGCGIGAVCMMLYIALFIHGIMSSKRTREVRPAVLVGESSTQLLMYSLDIDVR